MDEIFYLDTEVHSGEHSAKIGWYKLMRDSTDQIIFVGPFTTKENARLFSGTVINVKYNTK